HYCFFFLPKRLVIASTGFCWLLAAFPLALLLPEALLAVLPMQPSCDLSIPAARPPTSGTNLGLDVVPSTMKGTVVPLLQPLPPVTFPNKPLRVLAGFPEVAAVSELELVEFCAD